MDKKIISTLQDEISPADKKEPIADGMFMIPKYRFDEINDRYKEEKKQRITLEKTIQAQAGEIEKLCSQIEEIKSAYSKALAILRIKEIFIDAGIKEAEYKEIMEYLLKTSEEHRLSLAKGIVNLINIKNNYHQ